MGIRSTPRPARKDRSRSSCSPRIGTTSSPRVFVRKRNGSASRPARRRASTTSAFLNIEDGGVDEDDHVAFTEKHHENNPLLLVVALLRRNNSYAAGRGWGWIAWQTGKSGGDKVHTEHFRKNAPEKYMSWNWTSYQPFTSKQVLTFSVRGCIDSTIPGHGGRDQKVRQVGRQAAQEHCDGVLHHRHGHGQDATAEFYRVWCGRKLGARTR